MNIILNGSQRIVYNDVINELFELCPETMKRKIAEANVQQAFVLDYVRKNFNKDSNILSVGAYQDTATESLVKLGYNVTQIDPDNNMFVKTIINKDIINLDLHNYYLQNTDKKFDCILSTSVIEHVQNDEEFVDDMCKMLNIDGIGVLTCDFNNDYKAGMNKPHVDYRLYTKYDLLERLNKIIINNGCEIIGEINYDGIVDFHYENCLYTFATLTFKKIK